MDQRLMDSAKASLKRLTQTSRGVFSQQHDCHDQFATDLKDIGIGVPFQMFFVQEDDGEITDAAIIPDYVLTKLEESHLESKDILGKFKNLTKLNITLEAAGRFVQFSGIKCPFLISVEVSRYL